MECFKNFIKITNINMIKFQTKEYQKDTTVIVKLSEKNTDIILSFYATTVVW